MQPTLQVWIRGNWVAHVLFLPCMAQGEELHLAIIFGFPRLLDRETQC